MAESFLSNKNLSGFINTLKLNPEQNKFLLERLPTLDKKERVSLMKVLKDIFILNMEEAEVIDSIKNNWGKV